VTKSTRFGGQNVDRRLVGVALVSQRAGSGHPTERLPPSSKLTELAPEELVPAAPGVGSLAIDKRSSVSASCASVRVDLTGASRATDSCWRFALDGGTLASRGCQTAQVGPDLVQTISYREFVVPVLDGPGEILDRLR
jgi:hypothetical protein